MHSILFIQSTCLTVLFHNQVLFVLPLGLGPSTSCSMHFFTQWTSFRSTCPYHRSLFCCNTNAMSSDILYQLPPFTTIHSIFFIQFSLSSLLVNLSFSLTRILPCRDHLLIWLLNLSPRTAFIAYWLHGDVLLNFYLCNICCCFNGVIWSKSSLQDVLNC